MPVIDRVIDKSMLVEGQLRVDITFMRRTSNLPVTSRKWENAKKEEKCHWALSLGGHPCPGIFYEFH